MKTRQLMELADLLANDLLMFAQANNISSHDLLMSTAIAERLLQMVLCPQDPQSVQEALQEADATFVAVTSRLEPN